VAGRYAAPHRVGTVYYGIPEPQAPAEQTEAIRRELGAGPGTPVVGFVGRLHPQKGVDVFLHAAARVHERRPDCRFVVVGTGEIEAELRVLATQLGLDGVLRWVGGRPSAPFLPLFDVAVMTSRWEGQPLLLLELMAAGRAIVTSDVAGCLEAVGENGAAVVPVGQAPATAEAVLGLLDAPERAKALARGARERYLEQFTLAVMTRRFDTLYRELLTS
jgi:glycosyltransferase involved in cell wall biosynthesis